MADGAVVFWSTPIYTSQEGSISSHETMGETLDEDA